MTASPQTLAAVRVALAQPFTDPVNVGGIAMGRAEARALERILSSKSRSVPSGSSDQAVQSPCGGLIAPFSHSAHDGLDAVKGE